MAIFTVRNAVYLWRNLPSDGSKCGCSVDVFLVADLRDIHQDPGLSVDETIENVLLECRQVIRDLVPMSHTQGVATVGEEDGLQLSVVVQEVTGVDVWQPYLVFMPGTATEREKSHTYNSPLDHNNQTYM